MTFTLTAEPFQQPMFGASSFEAKPKPAKPPEAWEKLQSDLFANNDEQEKESP
jgi:hypothetical protein